MPKRSITLLERYQGSLLGLAVGDAMGVSLEFKRLGTFTSIETMIGGGPFGLKPGEWTDDYSLVLCLAESLIRCTGFDLKDQLARYCDWYHNGHLSSNGKCFDIGNTTRYALHHFEATAKPCSGLTIPVLQEMDH